jgi:methionyl-tRNA formyltransferase
MMKLAFMGTPDFAVPTLEALAHAGHEIAAVYTQPPRPAGRGKKEQKSSVHKAAERLGLDVRTPVSMKSEQELQYFADLDLDCAVVVAFGQILPQSVLGAARLGCLNVHASLLPRWRGAAPIHRALMAGDHQTGVCIMQMEAGLDTGPVLLESRTDIEASDTTASLHDRLAVMGASLINLALEGLNAGSLTPRTQPEAGVTYARKIDKAEAELDWGKPAHDIELQVRGLCPFPGAWTLISGERVKILAGHVLESDSVSPQPGVLISDTLIIQCGRGTYQIDRAQRPGKAAMDRETLLRGFSVDQGSSVGMGA